MASRIPLRIFWKTPTCLGQHDQRRGARRPGNSTSNSTSDNSTTPWCFNCDPSTAFGSDPASMVFSALYHAASCPVFSSFASQWHTKFAIGGSFELAESNIAQSERPSMTANIECKWRGPSSSLNMIYYTVYYKNRII